jgi:sRNA-binding carbon storage regulator CsrA
MPRLIVELIEGESISIGSAVVTLQQKKGRRVRLKVEAPQDLKVETGIKPAV